MDIKIKLNNIELRPTPLLSISHDFQKNGAQGLIGRTVSFSLEGKFYNSGTGSPGTGIMKLERDIRSLPGGTGTLSIGAGAGGEQKYDVRLSSFSSKPTNDNWTTTIDYTIELIHEQKDFVDNTEYNDLKHGITSCQDDWTIDTIEDPDYLVPNSSYNFSNIGFGTLSKTYSIYPFYRISRTIGAVGKHGTSSSISGAVSGAIQWVNDRLKNYKLSPVDTSNLKLYNFARSLSSSVTEGSYRVTDTWLATPNGSPKYIESFTIDTVLDESLTRTVSINGNIKGVEDIVDPVTDIYPEGLTTQNTDLIKIGTNSKIKNAIEGYSAAKGNAFSRATTFVADSDTRSRNNNYGDFNYKTKYGINERPLNPIPISENDTINPYEGSINYSVSYNNRPISYISGAVSENLSVQDNWATNIISSQFVLGRTNGPVLQDLGTVSTSTRTVSYDVTLPRPNAVPASIQGAKDTMTSVVESFNPSLVFGNYINNYRTRDSFDVSVIDGRLTRQITWEWTVHKT